MKSMGVTRGVPATRVPADSYRLDLGAGRWVEVRCVRTKVKYLRLRVCGDGSFALSVPWHCSRSQAVAFLEAQHGWVDTQLQRRGDRIGGTSRFEDGDTVAWWGRQLRLQVQPVPGLAKNRAAARIEGQDMVLRIEDGADFQRRAQVIDRLRKKSLEVRLEPLLARWSAAFGVQPRTVALRRMKSRWGSCQPQTGKLCFNLALSERDPKYLNYVVAHEFAHFFHPDHGPAFHALLETHLPEERRLRRELNRSDA